MFMAFFFALLALAVARALKAHRAKAIAPYLDHSRPRTWHGQGPVPLTRERLDAWINAKAAAALTDAEVRTAQMFRAPGYLEAYILPLRNSGRDAYQVLAEQWAWELELQSSVAAYVQVSRMREAALPSNVIERATYIATHPLVQAAETFAAAQATVAVEEQSGPETVAGPLAFKPHEPKWFREVRSQQHVVLRLETMVRALRAPEPLPNRHVLFTGPAGLGKTTLAKVFAHELRAYNALNSQAMPLFLEQYGSNLASIEDYDKVFREIERHARPALLFLDEIHTLDEKMATKLYKLMEDGLYAFHGASNPTPLPPVMVIGATTDYGDLHPALKRRFGEPMALSPLSPDQLAQVVRMRPFAVEEAAVLSLVEVCRWSGAPWEVLSLAYEAELVARADGLDTITEAHVRRVRDTLAVDDYGLRPADRACMQALFRHPRTRRDGEFVCFALSQADLCSQAMLDPAEFAAVVKPRLQSRGFLGTRSGYGQVLLDRAFGPYAALCPAEYHHYLRPRA